MSDRRAARPPRRTSLRAFAMVLMFGASLEAQTSAELGARISALEDSLKATQEQIRTERERQSLALDDSIVADGVTWLFPSQSLSDGDRATLRGGIADSRAALTGKFGVESARLLEGEVTRITFTRREGANTEFATFVGGRTGGAGRAFRMPLDRDDVSRYLLGRAGQRLMARDATLQAFAGAAFSLTPNEQNFYVARRQLAVSQSSVARRCAEGALPACRTVLDIRHPERRFAAEDSIPRNGIAIPQGVHATVVAVAIDLGGVNALDAIGNTGALDEPVAILAQAAGVTPDSLLSAWGTRLRAAGGSTATPSLPFVAMAFAWCGVFALVATRRRPR